MTKSWDDVRQEASRLYVQGATLSQVQARLESNFGFRASWVVSVDQGVVSRADDSPERERSEGNSSCGVSLEHLS